MIEKRIDEIHSYSPASEMKMFCRKINARFKEIITDPDCCEWEKVEIKSEEFVYAYYTVL